MYSPVAAADKGMHSPIAAAAARVSRVPDVHCALRRRRGRTRICVRPHTERHIAKRSHLQVPAQRLGYIDTVMHSSIDHGPPRERPRVPPNHLRRRFRI